MKVVDLYGSLNKLTFKLDGECVFNKSKLVSKLFLVQRIF